MNFPTQFDDVIKATATQWLPEWDWLYLKAQWCAESLLKLDAVSPTGARGPCQFEPDTWRDTAFRLRFPLGASPEDPKFAFSAGAYYMGLMRNGWAAPRSEDDRRKLAQASYNAGFGNILKAQGRAGGVSGYEAIIAMLPYVTGPENAKQTTDYVKRIETYYQQLKAGEGNDA
jgi:membrane-bound lytic murein transglycosylase MltF